MVPSGPRPSMWTCSAAGADPEVRPVVVAGMVGQADGVAGGCPHLPDEDVVVRPVVLVALGRRPPHEPVPVIRELREVFVTPLAGQVHEDAPPAPVRTPGHDPGPTVPSRLHPDEALAVGGPGRLARLLPRQEREGRAGRIVHRRARESSAQPEESGEAAAEREGEAAPVGGELDVPELLDPGQRLLDVEQEALPARAHIVAEDAVAPEEDDAPPVGRPRRMKAALDEPPLPRAVHVDEVDVPERGGVAGAHPLALASEEDDARAV